MSWIRGDQERPSLTLERPKTAIVQNLQSNNLKKKKNSDYKVVFESQLEHDEYNPFQNNQEASRNIKGNAKKTVLTQRLSSGYRTKNYSKH